MMRSFFRSIVGLSLLALLPALSLPAMQSPDSAAEYSALRARAARRVEAPGGELRSHESRATELLLQLAESLGHEWAAVRAPALPGWQRVLRLAERTTGFTWKGPAPIVLTVTDAGGGFTCPEGKCDGRFEGLRIVFRDAIEPDTVVVGVILLAESALMSEEVWQHEVTHALLSQHGLVEESQRHDPRYFATSRRTVAVGARSR